MRDELDGVPLELPEEVVREANLSALRNDSIIAKRGITRIEEGTPFKGDFEQIRRVSENGLTPEEVREPLGKIASLESMIPDVASDVLIEKLDALVDEIDEELF